MATQPHDVISCPSCDAWMPRDGSCPECGHNGRQDCECPLCAKVDEEEVAIFVCMSCQHEQPITVLEKHCYDATGGWRGPECPHCGEEMIEAEDQV